jgi:DNA repair protein RadD
MLEIDLLEKSPFSWCDLFGDDELLIANGFNVWGGIFYSNNNWYAIGGGKGHQAKLLAIGQRTICLAAADDWLNQNESAEKSLVLNARGAA